MKTTIGKISTGRKFSSSVPIQEINTMTRIDKFGKKIKGIGLKKKIVSLLISNNLKTYPEDQLFLNGRIIHFGNRSQKEGFANEIILMKKAHFTRALTIILLFFSLFSLNISNANAQGSGEVMYLQGYILKEEGNKDKTTIIVTNQLNDTIYIREVKNRYRLKFNLNEKYSITLKKGDSIKKFNIDTRNGVIAFSKLILDIDWCSRYNYAVLNISDDGNKLVVKTKYQTLALINE